MPIEQLSADDFEKIIKSKNVRLLDVREKYEFDVGRIRKAKLTPSTNFNEYFQKLKIKKSDKIALYCLNGNRSDFIGRKLDNLGYEKVYNLELGILDWMEQGKKIKTSGKPPYHQQKSNKY